MQTMVPVAREAKNYDFHLDLNQINNNINTQPRFNSMLAHGTNNFSLDNQRKLSNFNSIGNGSIMQDEQIRLRENPMKKVLFIIKKKKNITKYYFNNRKRP